MLYVRYAVEGPTDQPVAEKLLQASGLHPARPFIVGGKAKLDKKLPGINRSAAHSAWLVIRDLDQDDRDRCVPELRVNLLDGQANGGMCFRLAVRSIEAWLMADSEAFADFFAVRRQLPYRVDELKDPKISLLNLCRKSRRRQIREGVPPRQGNGRRVGPEYVEIVQKYVQGSWSPDRARRRSPSLERALRSLAQLRIRLESKTGSSDSGESHRGE